jgi:hypothetical protein
LTQINVIKIPCTPSIASALAVDTNNAPFCNLFDVSNNLVIPIVPGAYSRKNTGPAVEVASGFTSNRVKWATRQIEINYLIDDARDEIRMACEALIANATAVRGVYTSITIYDFCFVETVADKAQGYTIRQGAMEIETEGGTVNYLDGVPTGRRLGTGHKLRFVETSRRGYAAI